MLELTGRETLGVHVGQLLELERTLQRHRVADVAPQEQHRRRASANCRANSALRFEISSTRATSSGIASSSAVLARHLVRVLGAAGLRQRQARPDSSR